MKLEPKAKPVRIRIKSGGEEHFNLESLKRNFSVQDLWEAVIGKSLSRWLEQQDEKELADGVDGFCGIEKPSINDYVRFSNLFFSNEAIVDADSLLKFYQNKGLDKNVKNAFLELFDSLSFENGKQWFESFKHLKKNEEWVGFFEQRIDGLDSIEAAECHNLLSTLYKERGAFREMTYHQGKSDALLSKLAETDDKLLGELLESGDYQTVKALIENPDIENKVDSNKWIEVFRTRQDKLSGQDKGECLFILYCLYESVHNKGMANMALKLSASLGYQQARNKLLPSAPRYSKLKEIHQSYINYKEKISIEELNSMNVKIYDLCSSGEYYRVCYTCINMFINAQRLYTTTNGIKQDRKRISSDYSYEKPLVFLVAGLAWEEKTAGKELYYDVDNDILPDSFEKIFKAKQSNMNVVVTAECGLQCNILKDSIIEQMLFFMETFGEGYSFEFLK